MYDQVLITQPSEEESGGNAAIGLSVYTFLDFCFESTLHLVGEPELYKHSLCLSFNSLSSPRMSSICT